MRPSRLVPTRTTGTAGQNNHYVAPARHRELERPGGGPLPMPAHPTAPLVAGKPSESHTVPSSESVVAVTACRRRAPPAPLARPGPGHRPPPLRRASSSKTPPAGAAGIRDSDAGLSRPWPCRGWRRRRRGRRAAAPSRRRSPTAVNHTRPAAAAATTTNIHQATPHTHTPTHPHTLSDPILPPPRTRACHRM